MTVHSAADGSPEMKGICAGVKYTDTDPVNSWWDEGTHSWWDEGTH